MARRGGSGGNGGARLGLGLPREEGKEGAGGGVRRSSSQGGVRVLDVGERGGPAEAATATCGRGARDPPVRHSEGDAVFADTPPPAFSFFVFISLNETTIFSI